jgi:hypothetical protein
MLRDFVNGALHLRDLDVSVEAIDALIDEIWNAAENAGLKNVQRDHVGGTGATSNGDLEIAADEWIYLPFAPPAGYALRHIDLTGTESSAVEICDKIVSSQSDEPEMDFPGGKLSPEDLENVLFNTRIRIAGPEPATEAYYYVVPSYTVAADVAPVTASTPGPPTVGTAQATPAWLLPMWKYIDHLHDACKKHAEVLQDLFDLCSEGATMAMALTTIEQFLTVLERECKAPPPTSVLDRFAQGLDPRRLFDISNFHSSVKALRQAAKSAYVDECTFPTLSAFHRLCDDLKAFDSDQDFLRVYKEFDKVRGRYPATEYALQSVFARATMSRGFSPSGEAFTATIDKAVNGAPEQTPLFREIAHVLKLVADNVVSPAAAMIGNAPGPLSLLVAFGKLHLMWQMKTPATAVISVQKYVQWAANLAGISEDELAKSVASESSRNARIFATRIQATEFAASEMQAGPRWIKAVAFLDVIVFVSATCSTVSDIREKHFFEAAADGTGAASVGVGFVAAVLSLRASGRQAQVLLLRRLGNVDAANLVAASASGLQGMAKVCGSLVAIFGLASGVIQLIHGMRSTDDDRWGDRMSGGGTVLVSLQYFIDTYLSRYFASIGARVASTLADVLAEETALSIGSGVAAVLSGAGAVLAGVGVMLVVLAIVYKNRKAIAAFLEQKATPGPALACAAYLNAFESSRAIQLGPQSVKTALQQAQSALPYASFVNFFPSDSVKNELRNDGMSDDDLKTIGAFAPLSDDAMVQMSAGM